jgi:peptidoglycan/xylan/chitin deacetylase (PgdA/CDA1 family)
MSEKADPVVCGCGAAATTNNRSTFLRIAVNLEIGCAVPFRCTVVVFDPVSAGWSVYGGLGNVASITTLHTTFPFDGEASMKSGASVDPRGSRPPINDDLRRWLVDVIHSMIGTVTHVRTNEPLVALTFDDGPHPDYTLRLLDLLDQHGARATFFMVGEYMERHKGIVVRVRAAGHAVGNHTWSHVHLPSTARLERWRQIYRSQRLLGVHDSRLFRPPFGVQTWQTRLEALAFGYDVIGWSVHAEDWIDHPAEWMADRLERQIRPGSIVLLHDQLVNPRVPAAANREPLIAAVARVLQTLSGQYQFVTVPELMLSGKPVRMRWFRTVG